MVLPPLFFVRFSEKVETSERWPLVDCIGKRLDKQPSNESHRFSWKNVKVSCESKPLNTALATQHVHVMFERTSTVRPGNLTWIPKMIICKWWFPSKKNRPFGDMFGIFRFQRGFKSGPENCSSQIIAACPESRTFKYWSHWTTYQALRTLQFQKVTLMSACFMPGKFQVHHYQTHPDGIFLGFACLRWFGKNWYKIFPKWYGRIRKKKHQLNKRKIPVAAC